MENKWIIAIIFVIYMAAMVGIGLYVFRKRKNDKDAYLLAGRNLNPWVASMSAQASDMSGWLLTALPGLAFGSLVLSNSAVGAKEAIWTAIGLFVGTMVNWIVVARRLRVYTQVAGDSQTMPEYFQNRFRDSRGILRIVSAVIILFFFTIYTASMFSAGAKLFNSVFGMDYGVALWLGAAIIVAYVFMGGFLAVSYTDLVQGLLMFFTLLIVPLVMLGKMSPDQLAQAGNVFGDVGKLFPSADSGVSWMLVASSLGWGLGYLGMPHILVRFMATKDKRTIKPATVIAGVWCVLTLGAAVAIGILAGVFLGAGVVSDPEQVFIGVVQKCFPPVVAGVLLSAVLAAIMSTADSQLLVASTAFSNDIYAKVIRKNASNKELVWVNRGTIVGVSLVAALIAMDSESSIFELVSYAWAGFGASFGPLVLFSLYSKRVTLKGAVAAMITGAVTTIVFKYGLARLGGFWAIYELIPGFILSSAALWIVSLLDRKNSKKYEEDFTRMLEELRRDDSEEQTATEQVSAEVAAENQTSENLQPAADEQATTQVVGDADAAVTATQSTPVQENIVVVPQADQDAQPSKE